MGRDAKIRHDIALSSNNLDPVVRDHYGRVLEVGDEVIYQPVSIYRVTKIEPITEPGAPPGLMLVRLMTVSDMATQRNIPVEGLYRVREGKELRPRKVDLTDADQQAEERALSEAEEDAANHRPLNVEPDPRD